MVDHTDRFRPLKMTPGCYRIPDGHIVPQPPRDARAGMSRSEQVGWALVPVIAVVLMVAGIAGVLR